jgi:D-alanyl-D-alanine carboxypeptidase
MPTLRCVPSAASAGIDRGLRESGDLAGAPSTLAGITHNTTTTEMRELAWRISFLRLPHPRALAPILAAAIGATAVVALLTLGGHGATRAPGAYRDTRAMVPVPIAHSPRSACPPSSSPPSSSPPSSSPVSSSPVSTGPAAAGNPTRQSALAGVLDATLRAERSRLHLPALTAAVVVCGRVVWADATGVLDLGSKRPATNDSLFILNSAAKTFVATMIMQEIQDRHLSLDTRLSQFYPWLPNARQISVRMLLNMTSGLRDYLYNPRIEWMINHRPRHHWTVDQVLTALGTGLGPPRFAPGQGFEYSDTNYILLGAILERITHSSIQSDFQQLLARPLGITSATFVPTPAAKALIAHPYLRSRNGSLTSEWIPGFGVSSAVWGPVFTDGGLAASSLDVARFANALLGGRLVDAKAVNQMTRIGRGDYGFGIRGRSFDGHFWLGHRGYFGGFEAENWSDPSRQLTIAVATNLQLVGGAPISTAVWMAIAKACDRRNVCQMAVR